MRIVKLTWRPLLILVTFLGVGWWATSTVIRLGMAGNAPVAQVRLSSMMAGLFGGGAAALLVGILTMLGRRKGE